LTSLGSGIGRLEGALESAPAGWLADRFGPRWVIFVGLILTAAALVLMYFVHSIWSYFVVWGFLMGTGLNLGLTVTVDKTIINWFVRKRGLAQGIKFALIGVGGLAVVPIVTALVTAFDWRMTCLIWGFVILACAPLLPVFVKSKSPEHYGWLPDGAAIDSTIAASRENIIAQGQQYAASFDETEFTFKEAVRTKTFWFLVVAFIIQTVVIGGIGIHIIPFLTDRGISATTASAMMGLQVFFTIPSRFLGGIIVDRTSNKQVPFILAGAFALQAIGIGAFLAFQNTAAIYVFLSCYGLSSGGAMPVLTVVLGRYYGRKAFGSIFGVLRACQAPFSFIAPTYAGWVYDTTHSYTNAFMIFVILISIGVVVLCLVRPPRKV